MPANAAAPVAATSTGVSASAVVSCTSATPITDSTYPSRNDPPLEKNTIFLRNGFIWASSISRRTAVADPSSTAIRSRPS
jgi:hypothetical protein